MAAAGDDGGGRRGDRAVVDRVGQLVGGGRGVQVDVEVQVDLEGLGPLLLLGQGPMGAQEAQAAQLDAAQLALMVRARATSSRPGGPIWRELICSTMAMAWAEVGTSPA